MHQPHHRTRNAPRPAGGFTLIELILVMTLLVIAISVVAPRLSGFFHGRTLASEARRLLSLVHAGQSRAESEGAPMLLWIDASQRAYGLTAESAPPAGDPDAIEFSLEGDLQLSAAPASSVQILGRRVPAIRFLPEGMTDESSPASLRLSDADGAALWLVAVNHGATYEIRDTDQ